MYKLSIKVSTRDVTGVHVDNSCESLNVTGTHVVYN